jgi:ABC-type nickel/cobalt efflux system permease component RcnA
MALQSLFGPWPIFRLFKSYTQSIGLLVREIRASQGRYLPTHIEHKHIEHKHKHKHIEHKHEHEHKEHKHKHIDETLCLCSM